MDFKRYFQNEEVESLLKEWAERYPALVTLNSIGESYEKRPIWLATLTNKETGPDLEKPAIWVDANIHATEIAGTTTALYIIHNLLDNYGSEPRITRLLNECTFYVLPRLNPDGAALAMAKNPVFVRSGVRAYPWEQKDEGLHEQDIDGDGRILQMRILDPSGDWKISSLEPRLMEKRSPDEHGGIYYRLLSEGMIEKYDGYLIREARPLQGLDFNRNFPFEWRTDGEQHGAGPYPASEAEIRALVNFVTTHLNINVAITYHTFSKVILRPYSTKPDDEMETEDLWTYKRIGARGSELTGYRNVSVYHDFKYHPKEVTTGAFDDWMYDHFGVFAFTIELWDLPTAAGVKDRKFIEWWREHPHEEDVQILKWAEEHAGDGAYIDWYPYEHPQLGHIELGGWDTRYTWRNPPPDIMEQEAAGQFPFILALADMIPHLTIHTLEVNRLEANNYYINLVVENLGFLAVFTSQQGKKRKAIRPVRAEIDLPQGAELVSGKQRVELGHLHGRSRDLSVTAYGASDPTENRARAEWVIQASPGTKFTLNVLSERAGTIRREIVLPD
jgi:murein tripeptide amidase MpaA